MRILRPFLMIVGWLAASFAYTLAVTYFYALWNIFSWSPQFDGKAALAMTGILAALAGIWFLARATHDRASRIVSVILCFLMFWYAVAAILPAEPLNQGFIGRSRSSLLWFRVGILMLYCMPGFMWCWTFRRAFARGRPPQPS